MIKFSSTSVIIPCYNSQKTIGRALDSVLNQSWLVREILIIDDNSSDNTLLVANAYKEKCHKLNIKLVIFKNPTNEGASYSRNVGIKKATSKYIAFLDSDDIWHTRKVEIQTKIFEQIPDTHVIVGHQIKLNNNVSNIQKYSTSEFNTSRLNQVNKYKALFKNPSGTSVVMMKNDKEYFFDNNKRYSEDFLLWLEILFNNKKMIQLVDFHAASFKESYGESGLSANLYQIEKNELITLFSIWKKFNKGFMGSVIFCLSIFFSVVKYIRRILKVFLRSSLMKSR
ncbi:glycosyltransferase family 2 protein [Mangrovibacillus sp. Mu-81]|uniref:glycosyltransferase family 2 protein n=1 Tax=Mangrovibacillus sp. Mu-81 TaxID=3121478 RepID=UPI002FE4A253